MDLPYSYPKGNALGRLFAQALGLLGLWVLALLLAGGRLLPEAQAAGRLDFRFERMWPRLEQPWYFNRPEGIAVGPDGRVYVADTSNHRIQVFDSQGNFLTAWGSRGSGPGQFYEPSGLALDSAGQVYVVDTRNWRIQIFDSQGTFLREWGSLGSGQGQFYWPGGIALDSAGRVVYVADSGNHRIQVFDSQGTFLRAWGRGGSGPGQFYEPSGLALDNAGRVYVADTHNHRIQVFDSQGAFLREWGSYGSGQGQFHGPWGIALDNAGRVYVADTNNHRIQVFDSQGNFLRTWGSYGSGQGQFNFPYGITLDSAGWVYVADHWNHRIQVFDSQGTFLREWGSWGSEQGQFSFPVGIILDSAGQIYVADSDNNRIQVFDSQGDVLASLGTFGSGSGELNRPSGVGVSADGRLYVVDTENNRIQVFTPTQESSGGTNVPKTPRALIIGGRTATGDALDSSILSISLMQAYSALKAQGYRDDSGHDEIRVLWNGPPIGLPLGNVLPTQTVSPADFGPGSALTQWAQGGDRLLVYLVGHGNLGVFYLDDTSGQTLTDQALKAWLDQVQPSLADDITLIYEACHSGSFLPVLSASKRVLLASAAADQRALFLHHGLNSYSYSLWSELHLGSDLKQAQEKASLDMAVRYGDPQTPQLEANGNATANEKGDLQVADGRCIGIGVDANGQLIRDCLIAAAAAPRIRDAAPDQTLAGATRADLWVEVDPAEAASITSAWVVITRPDFVPDPNQSFDRLPVVDLLPDSAQGKQRWVGRYAPGDKSSIGETQLGFNVPGDYTLAYYVRNSDGLLSTPVLQIVGQNGGQSGGNSGYEQQIYTLYLGYFGRPPGAGGFDYYSDRMEQSGGNSLILVDDFFNSAESQGLYGALGTAEQVNRVFNFLFARDAAAGGLSYWTGLIDSGRISLAEMAYTIAYNAVAADREVLAAKIEVSKAFLAALRNRPSCTLDIGFARDVLSLVKSPADATTAIAGMETTLATMCP